MLYQPEYCGGMSMKVASSADQITPLAVGSTVPDGTLVTMQGEKTKLYDILQNKPAVIIFYRGVW